MVTSGQPIPPKVCQGHPSPVIQPHDGHMTPPPAPPTFICPTLMLAAAPLATKPSPRLRSSFSCALEAAEEPPPPPPPSRRPAVLALGFLPLPAPPPSSSSSSSSISSAASRMRLRSSSSCSSPALHCVLNSRISCTMSACWPSLISLVCHVKAGAAGNAVSKPIKSTPPE